MIRPAEDAFRRRLDAAILVCIPFLTLATILDDYVLAPWLRPQGALAGLNLTLTAMYLCVLPGGALAWRWIPEGGPDRAGWLRLIAFALLSFLALTLFRALVLGPPPATPF